MQPRVALTVNVKDADDQNPAFQYPRYAALLPRGGTQGQKLIVEPRDLRAFDQDVGLASPVFYTFASDEYKVTEVVEEFKGHRIRGCNRTGVFPC